MKKVFILMAFVVAVCCAQAQSVNQPGEKYPVYCSVKGYNFWGVGKVKVQLDLGYKTSNFETLLDQVQHHDGSHQLYGEAWLGTGSGVLLHRGNDEDECSQLHPEEVYH